MGCFVWWNIFEQAQKKKQEWTNLSSAIRWTSLHKKNCPHLRLPPEVKAGGRSVNCFDCEKLKICCAQQFFSPGCQLVPGKPQRTETTIFQLAQDTTDTVLLTIYIKNNILCTFSINIVIHILMWAALGIIYHLPLFPLASQFDFSGVCWPVRLVAAFPDPSSKHYECNVIITDHNIGKTTATIKY